MNKFIEIIKQVHLTKLQWIALLASLVWVLTSVNTSYDTRNNLANNFADSEFETCTENQIQNPPINLKLCEAEKLAEYNKWMTDVISNSVIDALLPLPFVWLYGFVALIILRSLYVGYGTVVDFKSLSKVKKAFGYFCYFMSAALLFITLMFHLENQVNQKVPARIGEKFRVWNYENRYVTVNGTWKSDNKRGESNLIFPMHTTKIRCVKETKTCEEARANLSTSEGRILMVDMKSHEIESWTNSSIVFKDRNTCFEKIYTIDLISQAVNGIEKIINAEGCSKKSKDYEPETYRLVDGDVVYNELRKQNSPWLQRIIFSMFNSKI
jgi:hypothetical protein